MPYRSFIVWGAGTAAVMIPFLLFVALGWPGAPDSCVYDDPPSCYCEKFELADVLAHKPGVRQPGNTWFNLYAVLTSGLVALVLFLDRRSGDARNVMRSANPIADLYVFAVLFLGLGSMWFHASIVQWAGVFDNLSMYVFAAFLVFYTVRRLWPNDLAFWLMYGGTVVLFTVISALWQWSMKSVVLIGILVVAYLTLEIIACVRQGKFLQGRPLTIALWLTAVVCILLATVFWILSGDEKAPLCDPESLAQPHGLLWHPLAGAMAVLLYFYWREEEPQAQVATTGEQWS